MAELSSNAPRPVSIKSKRRRRAQIRVMILSLILLGLIMVALPTFIVLVVGLLPAFAWFILDMTPGRHGFRCILGFNIAGVAPYIRDLWTGSNDVGASVGIVTDPLAWLVFLCAGGAGWFCFQALPAAVTMSHTIYAKMQIETMQKLQGKLEDEWGYRVTGKQRPETDEGLDEDPQEDEGVEAAPV